MAESDQADTKIDKLVTKISSETDTSEAKVRKLVDEKYEEFKDSQTSAMSDDDIRFHAVKSVNNKLKNMTGSSFSPGQVEELPILTLGYQERDGEYFVTDDDAIVGLGIVNPEDDPAGLCTMVIDSNDGVDLEYAKELFEPLNTIRGNLTRRQVGSYDGEENLRKGGQPTYTCESGPDTKLEDVDPSEEPDSSRFSELPDDWESKRDMINQHIIGDDEQITFQNYAEHESVKTESNSGRFEAAFGIDVKRIRGEVVDVFSNDSFGVMTILDETAFDESDVPEDLLSDQMRVAGLQIWMPPGLLKYDEGSIIDVYGYVDQSDDGQYQMRGFGSIPIIEFERDTSTGVSSDDVEEEVI